MIRPKVIFIYMTIVGPRQLLLCPLLIDAIPLLYNDLGAHVAFDRRLLAELRHRPHGIHHKQPRNSANG